MAIFFMVICDGYEKKAAGAADKLIFGIPSHDAPIFNLLIYIARDQGFFQELELDIAIQYFPTGLEALNALQDGHVDMVASGEFPFIGWVLKGGRMKIIASIAELDVLELIARKDRGVTDPADIKGKRVALQMGTQLEFFLDRFLLSYGFTLKKIQSLATPNHDITAKLIVEGACDAVVSYRPRSRQIKTDLKDNWVSWSIQNRQEIFWVITGRDQFINQHPNTVEAFIKAVHKAESLYQSGTEKTIDIFLKNKAYDKDRFRLMLPRFEYNLTLDHSLLIALEDEARWFIDNRHLEKKKIPNFLDHIYFKAMEAIKPDGIDMVH